MKHFKEVRKTFTILGLPAIQIKDLEKNKHNEKEAASREDWEGGSSRPAEENVPAQVVASDSPAKDLQGQAESVSKAVYGDKGPPLNLQSLPTQNTHLIDRE